MDKRTKIFFKRSIVLVVTVCILVFTLLNMYMSHMTRQAISEISNTYMMEMNLQLQQKFQSIMTLRLEQARGIIKRTPPETVEYGEDMLQELQLSASIRDFSFLGLYDEAGGNMEVILGDELELIGNVDVGDSLRKDGSLVTLARNSEDEGFLLLGVSAAYPMEDGGVSEALLVGMSVDYLKYVLFLDVDGAMLYSYIIDNEGEFIVKSADAVRANYFDRIRETYDDYQGNTVEDYVRELQEAMDAGKDYTARVSYKGVETLIYGSPLVTQSWYLISVMQGTSLTESITDLNVVRMWSMILSVVIILAVMTIIFVQYYKLAQRHLNEMTEAKNEAVRASMAKGEFLSAMSHDIRTPMNAIIGMTEIAQKNIKDPVRVEECLRKVSLSSKHLLGLINDVLDMSKIESGKMTLNAVPMSLRDAMDDIINIMQAQIKQKNQLFDVVIQKIIAEDVYCDSVRLNQVLINLLSNAVKFTPEGGRVEVYVYQEESPQGSAYVRTHFCVSDTGIGMSPEFQRKIWDTFAREETEQVRHMVGTGLGTTITKKIIDLMGGTIELKSEQGKGSTFYVALDMKKAEEKLSEIKLPGWDILVVDDNEQLGYSTANTLSELGVHAQWVSDGKKAVDMIEERHKENKDYDFILIDLRMPGMDGIETIHEIRKRVDKDIAIFLLSAYDRAEIEDQIESLPIEGFISKPLFKSTLYERLKQYVDGYDRQVEEKKLEVDFGGKHILLAEDMDINWEVAYEILSVFGLDLDRAVNGKECLDKFSQSAVGYYSAILMDIRMPVMNGYDAAMAVRALDRPDKDLPIIAMTADAFSDDAQHCLECSMNAHIPKPLDIKECIRVLSKYLCAEAE